MKKWVGIDYRKIWEERKTKKDKEKEGRNRQEFEGERREICVCVCVCVCEREGVKVWEKERFFLSWGGAP